MRIRSLGEARVTSVGVGDVRLARAAARGSDSGEVDHVVHAAIEAGLTLVEASEEPDALALVGAAVRALRARDAVTVATQVVRVPPRPGMPTRDTLPERLPAKYVQERVEAALRATKLDALGLAQLPIAPAWVRSSAWAELAGECARLVREGHVLAWGVVIEAGGEEEDVAALVGQPWFASAQVTWSACAPTTLVDAARAAKRTVIARHPLAGGALAGALGPGVKLTPRDDRNGIGPTVLEGLAVGAAMLRPFVQVEPASARSCDAARAVLEKTKRREPLAAYDLAELALRAAIDRAGIALPRISKAAHVPAAVMAASAAPLADDLLEEVLATAARAFSTMAR